MMIVRNSGKSNTDGVLFRFILFEWSLFYDAQRRKLIVSVGGVWWLYLCGGEGLQLVVIMISLTYAVLFTTFLCKLYSSRF